MSTDTTTISTSFPKNHDSRRHWALTLGALGVVFGDIGTSPLYAFRECFHGAHGITTSFDNIAGVLSIVIWSLIITISIKYLMYVMLAHNRGEGGVMALTALLLRKGKRVTALQNSRLIIIAMGLFGSALLYADSMITPAISVLGAMEGLNVVTPVFSRMVIPLSLIILLFLFAIQSHGTERIGVINGPIILLWFFVLGAIGLVNLFAYPSVLLAFNPYYAVNFLVSHAAESFAVLGAVFLVLTGAEALYADMGHFGRKPIAWGWFAVVVPGLILNYFGQGALLLTNTLAKENPFYYMFPRWALIPAVILATLTSVIASQAVISGAFSLSRQAVQLGYFPRLTIVHTSASEIGQIFVPATNRILAFFTLLLVVIFQTSGNLAAAYGLAVATTMLLTTILMFYVSYYVWKWRLSIALLVTSLFGIIDLGYLYANALKITHGGWFSLIVAVVVYQMMRTWHLGRKNLSMRIAANALPLDTFRAEIAQKQITRVPGVSVFMTRNADGTPIPLIHNVKHNKVLHELVILLTIETKNIPSVLQHERVEMEFLGDGFYRVIAYYGFQETPKVEEILRAAKSRGVPLPSNDITYFLGRESLTISKDSELPQWRQKLFSFLSRNAEGATSFYQLPSERVFEVGMQVEL